MTRSISYRELTEIERKVLANETKQSPYIGFIHEDIWSRFGKMFVVSENKTFLGACAIVPLRDWAKIGPLFVLSRAQGQGLGKQLLTHVIKTTRNKNIYIGTPNPKVVHMANSFGFQKITFWQLPWAVKRYLFIYLFERMNWEYVVSSIRKKLTSKNFGYEYFVKYAPK